jgi:hypothetical protein
MPHGLCCSPAGYLTFMTEDATDPTGERLREPEGPDTPDRKPPPDDAKDDKNKERQGRQG